MKKLLKYAFRALRYRFIVDPDEIKYVTNNLSEGGIAVDIGEGLIVPVLKNADKKDLKVICRELKDLTGKSKKSNLSETDLSGGIITITNLGMYGIKYFSPILNYPEGSILGVGAIVEKPVVKNGRVEIGSVS